MPPVVPPRQPPQLGGFRNTGGASMPTTNPMSIGGERHSGPMPTYHDWGTQRVKNPLTQAPNPVAPVQNAVQAPLANTGRRGF